MRYRNRRIPFDFLWRTDLKDTLFVMSKCRKFYYGPFFPLQQIQPVFDFLTRRAPDRLFGLVKYRGIVEELLSADEFFTEYTDTNWIRDRASSGDAVYQRLLGFIYANAWLEGASYDVRPDFDREAKLWLDRAVDQGDRIACDLKRQISTPERGAPYYSELRYPVSLTGLREYSR